MHWNEEIAASNSSRTLKCQRTSWAAATLLALCLAFACLAPAAGAQTIGTEPGLTQEILEMINEDAFGGERGVLLKQVGGHFLAGHNVDFEFYPASTIKVLHLVHAVHAADPDDPDYFDQTLWTCKSCKNWNSPSCSGNLCTQGCTKDNCNATSNCGPTANTTPSNCGGLGADPISLRCALERMMIRSDNQATNAVQEHFGFGPEPAEQGRQAIERTALDLGLTATRLNHKLGCDGDDGPNPNRATLRDLATLYERVATDPSAIADFDFFRGLMLNEKRGNFLRAIFDEEIRSVGLSASDPDVAAVRNGFKLAYKGGNAFNAGDLEDRSIAGWVGLPAIQDPASCTIDERGFVFGVFIEDASLEDQNPDEEGVQFPMTPFVSKLLRDEIHQAVEDVRCARPPVGGVTSPAACQCFGPAALPVVVGDDFQDSCTADLTRTYTPSAALFSQHGDHAVTLTASDACGNAAEDETFFTVDLVAPQLEVASPLATTYTQPDELPIPILFASLDLDGARGGVVHEEVLLDGEPLYDGSTFGDGDGRLSDELSADGVPALTVGLGELCASGPGLDGEHELTVVARDCGGNAVTRTVPFAVDLPGKRRCDDAVPHHLVVNEVDYDQGAVDDGEFIEIKNVGTQPVRLADYAIRTYYFAPFETRPRFGRYERYAMADAMLAPGDYFVVCTADNEADYCDQHVEPTGWGFQTPELLRETSPATVSLVYNPTANPNFDRLVDSVCYLGSESPGDPGFGVPGNMLGGPLTEGLCNTQIETAPGAGVSRVPDGLDRDTNLGDLRQACITPKAPNAASPRDCAAGGEALGRLVINELDVNQPQHPDVSEFVEIYNAGTTPVHVEDYVLVHRYLDPAQSFHPQEVRLRLSAAALPPSVALLPPGGYLVACRSAFPATACAANPLFPLHDQAGVVALVHNATGLPEHDRLVDSVAYGAPNASFEGGPASGGAWVEGLPIALADGAGAVGGMAGTGFSRLCDGADTDANASDFALLAITPGTANAQP